MSDGLGGGRLAGLYAITPDEPDEPTLLAAAGAVLAGGARLLQYRDKTGNAGRRLRLAQALLKMCRQHAATFIINDDWQLAGQIGADGVHLGSTDGDLSAVRQQLPAGSILGASCYASFDLAQKAVAAGADYVAFGAVFLSPTKPLAVRAPLDLFSRCRQELSVPSCAIGGITLENAAPVIAAGASMLAVITDIFEAPDIAGRTSAYQSLFEESCQ
ncbi:MAG: thiamine phosphate synthase [Zoogloeaceae bacterium]|nr:thiamine phosphate synthase [Zoogloeaceae bacterium]